MREVERAPSIRVTDVVRAGNGNPRQETCGRGAPRTGRGQSGGRSVPKTSYQSGFSGARAAVMVCVTCPRFSTARSVTLQLTRLYGTGMSVWYMSAAVTVSATVIVKDFFS